MGFPALEYIQVNVLTIFEYVQESVFPIFEYMQRVFFLILGYIQRFSSVNFLVNRIFTENIQINLKIISLTFLANTTEGIPNEDRRHIQNSVKHKSLHINII